MPEGTVARMQVELIRRTFVHAVAPMATVGDMTESKLSPTTMISVAAAARPIGGLTPMTLIGG